MNRTATIHYPKDLPLALSEATRGKGTAKPGERGFSFATIENPAYLIPAGTYTLGLHRWTKSGKLVPILEDVPGRSYILIHNGTREEHSHGCILAPQPVIDALVTLIQHSNEKVSITIQS